MIVTALFSFLMVSSLGTLYLNHRASRRQAELATALELVQGQIETLRGMEYVYPSALFTNVTRSFTNTVTVAVDQSGRTNLLTVPLITTITPFGTASNMVGHVVTASITLDASTSTRTVRLQTLLNKFTATR